MAGIFDYLNNVTQSPMFLAGAGLLSGGGFGAAMQGMQAGQRAQAIHRQQMQEDQRRQAFEGLFSDPKALQGIPMGAVNIARAAGPESGLQMLAGMMPKPRDPLETEYKRAQIDKMRADAANGGRLGNNGQIFQDKGGNFYGVQFGPQGPVVNPIRAGEQGISPSKGVLISPDGTVIGKATGDVVRDIRKGIAETGAAREAAKKTAAADVELKTSFPKAQSALRSIETSHQNVKATIREAVGKINGWSTGLRGQLLSSLGGTEATDLAGTLDTIASNLAFDKLQDMRANSPTGGALGAVSDREIGLLQSTIASIKQSQTGEQLRANLMKLDAMLDRMQSDRTQAFRDTYGSLIQQGGGDAKAALRAKYNLE